MKIFTITITVLNSEKIHNQIHSSPFFLFLFALTFFFSRKKAQAFPALVVYPATFISYEVLAD